MAISTPAELIRTYGVDRAQADALIHGDDQRLTYAQLHERSSRVAQALLAEGVGPQDRVAILDKNGPEYFELLFGASKLNAVHVAVNWRLAPPEIAHIVDDAQAKVLAVGEEFLGAVASITERLGGRKVVVIGDPGASGYESFAAWRDRHDGIDPGAASADDDVAFQMYSSGTTGLPKGVMLTSRNLFSSMPLYADVMGMSEPGSVNLVAMPLFHIGGGGWAMAGLNAGIPGVLVREVDPVRILDLIERHRVTHGFLVPAVLQFLLAVPGVEQRDLSSLRCILYGASPISTDVLARSVRTFGCDFRQAYGLTETSGTIVMLPPEDHDPDGPHPERLRAAGKPTAGVEVKVVDAATGEEVPVGEVGEIWIRSPQVMKGYWGMPEETAKAIQPDGYFRSGDAGYLDDDGYVYIHDRVKDMIVSGGENIYPAEVENALMSHPAVADCAVIGVPSDRWGETPKALVVLAEGIGAEVTGDEATGAGVTGDELIAYCREHLAKYKCPTSVEFIEAIPRNPSGKILKKDLRAPFWAGRERLVN